MDAICLLNRSEIFYDPVKEEIPEGVVEDLVFDYEKPYYIL